MSNQMIRMCAVSAGMLAAPLVTLVVVFFELEDRTLANVMIAMLAGSIALDVDTRLRKREKTRGGLS